MTAIEDARAVREMGNRLGNQISRGEMSNAEVVAAADMLDRYADLIEALTAPPTDDDREALEALVQDARLRPGTGLTLPEIAADIILAAGFRRLGPITDANPQAWQYGVLGGFPESVMGPMSSRASAEGLCGGDPARLMRRRPGIAPGPWEPVETDAG